MLARNSLFSWFAASASSTRRVSVMFRTIARVFSPTMGKSRRLVDRDPLPVRELVLEEHRLRATAGRLEGVEEARAVVAEGQLGDWHPPMWASALR